MTTGFERAYPLAWRVARSRAYAVVRRFALPRYEQEDLVQEGVIELWQKLAQFTADRGALRTFAEITIGNRLISVARSQTAVTRGIRVCESLSSVAAELEPAVEQPDTCLRIDLARALNRVPPDLRRVILLLSDSGPAEVSRASGWSPTRVYRAIARTRAIFVEAGVYPAECSRKRRFEPRTSRPEQIKEAPRVRAGR